MDTKDKTQPVQPADKNVQVEAKSTTNEGNEKKEKKGISPWLWVLLGILTVLSLCAFITGIFMVTGAVGGLMDRVDRKADVPFVPVVEPTPIVEIVTPPDVVIYECKAIEVGTPTETGGECSFCTINYSKPGEVFVIGKEPMEYTEGAWVYQYPNNSFEGFKGCIIGQSFFSDPDHTVVWK